MMGRGNRTRGVCDGILYINSGDNAQEFNRKLKLTYMSETLDYIKLLQFLTVLHFAPE